MFLAIPLPWAQAAGVGPKMEAGAVWPRVRILPLGSARPKRRKMEGHGNLDPSDVPAVVEIYSKSSAEGGGWFVGLVVKRSSDSLTVRFLDSSGEQKEKLLSYTASEVDYFGTHLGWPAPPGVMAVPSSSRKGQVSYLDPQLQQKFASPELAWQAYLEHRLTKTPVEVKEELTLSQELAQARARAIEAVKMKRAMRV